MDWIVTVLLALTGAALVGLLTFGLQGMSLLAACEDATGEEDDAP